MTTCAVYILTNPSHSVLYIGMTTDASRRLETHKSGALDGFAKKYNCRVLIYFEAVSDRDTALYREKQLKGWTRAKKEALISGANPHWIDLSHTIT